MINPNSTPFLVEILVNGFQQPGLFIIDNVKYTANLCDNVDDHQVENRKLDIPMAQVPSHLIDKTYGVKTLNIKELNPNICAGIECNFESDLCGYTQPELSNGIR